MQCGDASLWPVSGLVFFGAATALAHGDDLCEGAPWPSLAYLSRDPTCIARPRPGLAPKRRPTPIPPAPAKRPQGQSPTPATGGPWRPVFPHQPTVLPPCGTLRQCPYPTVHGPPSNRGSNHSHTLASPSLRSVILRVCRGPSGQTSLGFPQTFSRELVNT